MAKRPSPGRCVYCLEHFDDLTWDHVFPNAWYPNTTPPNIEKWKAPSCAPCNAKLGQIEESFLLKLSLCLDRTDPSTVGVVERAIRAIEPVSGRDQNDIRHREQKRKRTIQELLAGGNLPENGRIPGFDRQPGVPADQQIGLAVPEHDIHRLGEKIVRGFTYYQSQELIQPPYSITVDILQVDAQTKIDQRLRRCGKSYDCGPGISVVLAKTADDKSAGIFSITIWGLLKLVAFVKPG